jgi:hypothetical protein
MWIVYVKNSEYPRKFTLTFLSMQEAEDWVENSDYPQKYQINYVD